MAELDDMMQELESLAGDSAVSSTEDSEVKSNASRKYTYGSCNVCGSTDMARSYKQCKKHKKTIEVMIDSLKLSKKNNKGCTKLSEFEEMRGAAAARKCEEMRGHSMRCAEVQSDARICQGIM